MNNHASKNIINKVFKLAIFHKETDSTNVNQNERKINI